MEYRIHWNNAPASEWMDGDTLYNTIWNKESFVLYIEESGMQPHLNNVLYMMRECGTSAMGKDGELLLYREGHYYIEGKRTEEWEIRAALQARYTADPEDYIEDKEYVRERVLAATSL